MTTTTTEFTDADLLAAKPERTPDETTDEYVMRCMSAAVANSIKTLMEQEPVGVTDMAGGIHWKRGTPIQAKLYAAPMPQANESEAVKALRELVRLHENRQYIGDCPEGWVQAIEHARAVLAGEPGAKNEQATVKQDLQVEQPKQAQNDVEAFTKWAEVAYRHEPEFTVRDFSICLAAWLAARDRAQASGKAAPSDEEIISIARRLPHLPWAIGSRREDALRFARALLERYGNSGSICAVEIKDGK